MKVRTNLNKGQLQAAASNLMKLSKSLDVIPDPENPVEVALLRDMNEVFSILTEGIQSECVDMLTEK